MSGVTGFGFSPLPANRRDKRPTAEGWNGFKVRHVVSDSDAGIPYTGWEICLPSGCLNVNSTCIPINIQATRVNEDGDEEPLDDWYRMPFPDASPSDGDEWIVMVHAKVGCGISGVDSLQSFDKNYLFAEAHERQRSSSEASDDMSFCGDGFSAAVCEIKFEMHEADGSEELKPNIRRTVSTPLSLTVSRNREFELAWMFEVDDEDLTIDVKRMFIRNQTFSAAGTTFSSNTLTEIPLNAKYVYLKISASSNPYTGSVITYAQESRGNGISAAGNVLSDIGPTDIAIRLYVLDNCRVTEDDRDGARNIQLYK